MYEKLIEMLTKILPKLTIKRVICIILLTIMGILTHVYIQNEHLVKDYLTVKINGAYDKTSNIISVQKGIEVRNQIAIMRSTLNADRLTLIEIDPEYRTGKLPYDKYKLEVVTSSNKVGLMPLQSLLNKSKLHDDKMFLDNFMTMVEKSIPYVCLEINESQTKYNKYFKKAYNLANMYFFTMGNREGISHILIVEVPKQLTDTDKAYIIDKLDLLKFYLQN